MGASTSDSVLCPMRITHIRFLSHTTHSPKMTSKSVVGKWLIVDQGFKVNVSREKSNSDGPRCFVLSTICTVRRETLWRVLTVSPKCSRQTPGILTVCQEQWLPSRSDRIWLIFLKVNLFCEIDSKRLINPWHLGPDNWDHIKAKYQSSDYKVMPDPLFMLHVVDAGGELKKNEVE